MEEVLMSKKAVRREAGMVLRGYGSSVVHHQDTARAKANSFSRIITAIPFSEGDDAILSEWRRNFSSDHLLGKEEMVFERDKKVVLGLLDVIEPKNRFVHGYTHWLEPDFIKHVLEQAKPLIGLPRMYFEECVLQVPLFEKKVQEKLEIKRFSPKLMTPEEILWTILSLSEELLTKAYASVTVGYVFCNDGRIRSVQIFRNDYSNSKQYQFGCACDELVSRRKYSRILVIKNRT